MDGGYGVECLCQGEGYRVGVEWGKVRDSCRGTWDSGMGLKTMGKGWYGFGGKRVTVPSGY
ncbi:hypothetical protein Tco_0249386, partial [Tanacetum coccineum]